MRSQRRALARLTVLAALAGAAAVGPLPPAPAASAQPAPVTAELDRTTATTDDIVVLTVTVRSDDINPPVPEVPPFDGFEILGSGSSRQIEIVNGAVQSQAVYTYQLRPLRLGRLTIGPVTAEIDGQSYASPPLTLTVAAGAAPTPAPATPDGAGSAQGPGRGRASPLLRVEAAAAPERPYVGQAVVYTFRFIRSTELQLPGQPRYTAPAFTGLWNQFAPEQTRQTVQNGAAVEIVSELRTVLFPTTPGRIVIEPATLVLPGGFTRQGTQVRTEPVTLEVRPLPDGAPPRFSGAVGRYQIDATLDRTHGVVDEPFTLTVTVGGDGNIDALPEPAWPPLPAGWRALDGKSSAHSEARGGRVSGARRFERLLVPTRPGPTDLPAIPFVFFDPATERYETVSSAALRVEVAPAADGTSGAGVQGAAPAEPAPGAVAAAALRGDKPIAGAAAGSTGGPSPWAPWAWLVPALALLGQRAWPAVRARWRRRPAPDVALAQARERVRQARGRGAAAPACVADALTTYAAHRLGQRPDGLTRGALATRLGAAGVDPAWIARLDACLRACDALRFAPAASSTDATAPGSGPGGAMAAGLAAAAPIAALVDEAEAILTGLAAEPAA